MPKTLLLIDGTAHLYRTFYAIRKLTDPQGRPVNVVFGFAQTWLNLLEKFQPSHAVAVFDRPEPTFRHKIFPEYKAQREATPEELVDQIPGVKALLEAFQLKSYEQPGIEADDILGTLALRAEKAGFETLIFTNDKDLFQLVDPKIKIVRPVRGGKGEYEILGEQDIERVFGVPPEKVAEVLALTGDTADNIPGIPGIGPKTAIRLIQKYGSLENIYASLAEIKAERIRENLKTHRALAEQAKELVRIVPQAELSLSWEQCQVLPQIPSAAYDHMSELGFKRLLLQAGVTASAPAAASWATGLSVISSPAEVLKQARKEGKLAMQKLKAGIALAASHREAAWLPLQQDTWLAQLQSQEEWLDILCDPQITKISYDLKPIATALLKLGRKLQGPCEDLHLMAHLLDLPANRPEDFVARLLGGPPPPDQPALIACALWTIIQTIHAQLNAQGGEYIYQEIELPLLPVLAAMEVAGVALDLRAWQEMSERLGQELKKLEKEIHQMAGVEFNLRSPQQLAEVLFQHLQLSPGKKTKTGHSTDSEVLEMLAAFHPLPGKILEYRLGQKLKSTYLDVLPTLIDPQDQRLHTTFHQVGAATGRLSSSDPNLQNIPIRTEQGRNLRRMFVPRLAANRLLSADYSQIELRLLAHLSQDKQMLADFAAGLDIHRATASAIFNVLPEQVTPEMRRQAKTSNFGIAYGVTPYGLSRQLGLTVTRAKSFIDSFYQRYPGVRHYIEKSLSEARASGYVSTLLGRRRATPDLHSANRNVREAGERMAINAPIQGSAADLIKLAMIRIARELEKKPWQSQMILQVHDELLFEGPEGEMPELKAMVVQQMSRVYPLQVELAVEAAWGRNWMEAHG